MESKSKKNPTRESSNADSSMSNESHLDTQVRTRFAPSPTGFLHIGGARTALLNWLFARSQGGQFLLRIEDTDVSRSEKKYEDEIKASLSWMGVDWDNEESVMRQSERFTIYKEIAEELIKKGAAYRCESESGSVVRFKMPQNQVIQLTDCIMGDMTVNSSQLDDFVILRSDGTATFMLANVVDDEEMQITDILRGPEHLSNTFRQQPLLKALGYRLPRYSHLSLIHNLQGQKLSKRDGATGVMEYKDMGILPEAFCNYVLRLGWGCGDIEHISMSEVIKIFKLNQLGSSPAKIDPNKLYWLNGYYMRSADISRIRSLLKPGLPNINDECLKNILEKSTTLIEVEEMIQKVFSIQGVSPIDEPDSLTAQELQFVQSTKFLQSSSDKCKEALISAIDSAGLNKKKILMFYRVALTGAKVSPGLFEVICNLPSEWIKHRIQTCIDRSSKTSNHKNEHI